jgi:hypothetical protein
MIYGSSFIYVCRVGYHRQVIFAKEKDVVLAVVGSQADKFEPLISAIRL